jgi:hypothetical protein
MSFWRVRGGVVHQSSEPWICELLPTYVGCPKMGLAVCMLIRMPDVLSVVRGSVQV